MSPREGPERGEPTLPSAAEWCEVRDLVEAALALPAGARGAHLEKACGGNGALRAQVEAMVRACERADGDIAFLSEPAGAFLAPLLEEDGSAGGGMLDELRGTLADRYAVERELGRGGSATVYLALDRRHGRRVAIKVLDPALGATLSGERFLREIRVTASLAHPHILPLFDSGEAAGLLYFVMPDIEGETLRERLARDGRLPVEDAVRLLRGIAEALAYAHGRGVVHRDIKPANVLLQGGHALLADFGIARALGRAREAPETPPPQQPAGDQGTGSDTLTAADVSPGTPAYMAPEQAVGGVIDERTDLYALGVIAYEMLVGRHPFAGRAGHALGSGRAEPPPPLEAYAPDVPPALAALVLRLLSAEPADRPSDAQAVLHELAKVQAASAPRQRVARALLPVSLALLLVLAGGGYLWSRHGARSEEPRAMAPARSRDAPDRPPRGTLDPEANELYLQGRYHFLLRGVDNVRSAIAFFQQAIRRDPDFAGAHAGLAMAYRLVPVYLPVPMDSMLALMDGSARRAVALDSTLADGQLALAMTLMLQLRFEESLERHRIAVALDPSSASAHLPHGFSLLNLGRSDEGIVELNRALQLDPQVKSAASAAALGYLAARRYDEALAAGRHALALDSTFPLAFHALGLAQVFGAQPDSAVITLQRGIRLNPGDTRLRAYLVLAYAFAGRWQDAARERAYLHRGDVAEIDGTEAARAHLAFGDPEPLLRVLTSEQGLRRYLLGGGFLGCNPLHDPLWAEPRFRARMRELGVPPCAAARSWPLPSREGADFGRDGP